MKIKTTSRPPGEGAGRDSNCDQDNKSGQYKRAVRGDAMSTAESTIQWEQVSCDLCKSTESEKELDGADWECGVSAKLSLVKCKQCGLVYLNPRPARNSLPLVYPLTYGFYQPPARFLSRLTNPHALFRAILEKLRPTYPYLDATVTGTILDVGCATGHSVYPYGENGSLKQLKENDWHAYGCELDERAAEIGRASGLDIRLGRVSELDFGNQRFDVVRFNHVLEHCLSPMEDLSAAAKLLKHDGQLIVSGPNIQSAAYALFRQWWSGLDLPRHLYHFTPAILHKYCAKLGLRVYREYFDGYSEDLVHSLKHFLQSDSASDRNSACAHANVIAQLFGPLSRWRLSQVAKVLASRFNGMGLGDNYTLIAKLGAQ